MTRHIRTCVIVCFRLVDREIASMTDVVCAVLGIVLCLVILFLVYYAIGWLYP